jgi:metallo-beta-lactamase class B
MPAIPRRAFGLFFLLAVTAHAENPASWSQPQEPLKIYGNTYYVGTRGLGSLLITSREGHVLIDGAVPEAAPMIAAHIRQLGFKVEDVKAILNSHVHFDHAGGISELQQLTGATVWASPTTAKVLERGGVGPDDPQLGTIDPTRKVAKVAVIAKDGIVRVGPLVLTAHYTPGHTSGGTSWTWQSCEEKRCLHMVYADSLTAVSAPDFKYTKNTRYPDALKDLERSFAKVAALKCDILVTPHPDVSAMWERVEKRDAQGERDALINSRACEMYVDASRERLRKRLEQERIP